MKVQGSKAQIEVSYEQQLCLLVTTEVEIFVQVQRVGVGVGTAWRDVVTGQNAFDRDLDFLPGMRVLRDNMGMLT